MAVSKKNNLAITLGKRTQIAFILTFIFMWLAQVISTGIFYVGNYVGMGTWVFQASQWLLPVLFLVVSLLFVRKRYAQRLHALFMAFFITVVGMTAFSVVSMLENSIRYRFFPPTIGDFNDRSLITAFGHEWLIMGIGIVTFTLLLFAYNYQKRLPKKR